VATTEATRMELPIILVRGFGGLDVGDEKKLAYYGFNDGTVYPQKRGENYIYEGMILRFLKSAWRYQDATNVIGFYGKPITDVRDIPDEMKDFPQEFFVGDKIVVDPAMARALRTHPDPNRTLWVFRYYDLDDRNFEQYGVALRRLIELVRSLVTLKTGEEQPKVNIIAHSMGGLIVRETLQVAYRRGEASEAVNKVVTLGTPHQGISFQRLGNLKWLPMLEAKSEIARFDPEEQAKTSNPAGFKNLAKAFPLDRFLTVIGTNYRTFGVGPATFLNRLFSVDGEFGLNYNRSDGLVKIASAGIPGAPRAFVHKCHGGADSLITSREAFEIATRFFHGDIHAGLRLVDAEITRGGDFLGKSEFFIGVSLKPRGVDFDLFHQSREAENCYGPFTSHRLDDAEVAFDWLGPDRTRRLLYEGWLDSGSAPADADDLVMRVETYVGERDLFGIGFSDNLIHHGHCYVQARIDPDLRLAKHITEAFPDDGVPLTQADDRTWLLPIEGEGFRATFGIELSFVPDVGSRALV
jgi:triacylglycerol esterase/lipase EstA (alpha/beta hydrolase family)